MPTVAEMELLNRALSDLGGTFQRNRQMNQQRGQQDTENVLQREMMRQRQEELGERREERTTARADLTAHRETMAQIQRETKELQDRHYRLMQASGLLKTLQDGLKDGTINAEKLKGGLADNPLLKELGLGVDLFQVPPAKKAGFNTRSGHNLEMAEDYRQRASAAQQSGAGDEAERFRAIAERLERGVGPEEKEEFGEMSQEVGEVDPITGKGAATVRRKIPLSELEAEIRKMQPGAAPANAPAAPAPAAAAPDSGGGQFASEQAARAAGKKAGDIVILVLNGKPTRVRLK